MDETVLQSMEQSAQVVQDSLNKGEIIYGCSSIPNPAM
jgi:hypothetical protein